MTNFEEKGSKVLEGPMKPQKRELVLIIEMHR